eukprot:TRINITY_DN1518_c0_g4_i2.p1 TRINITY_DN1518_c0_g4~~TRINITY_DN1518_c0_g4_i2.p1  ORF type:complete len:668 (-),score=196.14 TRINITY_DN1518_c0_g4_i2:102-2105(-)
MCIRDRVSTQSTWDKQIYQYINFFLLKMSNIKQDQEDIKYLMSDQIGKILGQGLATLYQVRPKFPIEYFGKWLLNKSQEIKNQQTTLKQEEFKTQLKQEFENRKIQEDQELEETKKKKAKKEELNEQFKQKIRDHLYHDELLVSEFPEYLEKTIGLTGVYVGYLNYPVKEINDDEEDENAHLQTTLPKLINYIGYSASHTELMKGKTLPKEQSVTGEVFKEKEPEEQPPQQNEDEQQPKVVVQKPTYVYIPDVVKEPRMTFFRIPKLGAYIAIPLIYKSCLQEHSFQTALEERQKFIKAKEDQDLLRAQKQQEYDDKLKEMEEAGEDTTEFTKNFKAEMDAMEVIKESDIINDKKEYVVCADTMGQDCEITEDNRKFLEDYVKLFAQSWEQKEVELLKKDIDKQITYLHSLPANYKDLVDNYNDQEEKSAEEKAPQFEEFKEKNEKEYTFELDCAKLDKLKELLEDKVVQEYFLGMKEFRVLRFPIILQNILYLLNYKREEINIPNTHLLNWKYVKEMINPDLIKQIISYNLRGQKPNKVEKYALVNRILAKVEKIDQDQVDQYNLYYGRLLKWLKCTCKLRKQDIENRRANIEKKKTLRQSKIEEEAKLQELKATSKQAKLAEIPPEEQEAFDWTSWEKQFSDEHPPIEIPEEVQDEVDEDCEFSE